MLQIFKSPNYNIIGRRRVAFLLSGTLILISAISIFLHHGLKYGIDFTGGTLIQIHVDKPVSISTLRTMVADAGVKGAEIQNFGTLGDFLIKYQSQIDASKVKEAIEKGTGAKVAIHRTEQVGPRIGKELQRKALL
jgi:preprotein translocase subunit SecF